MIRPATHADIGAMLLLGEQMHAESRFAPLDFSHAKMAVLFARLIDDQDEAVCLVSERDGQITGGFGGWLAESYFSHDKTSSDFYLFVRQDQRGSRDAFGLLRGYLAWAKRVGSKQIDIGITTGIHLEQTTRLFRAVGFEPVGTVFQYQGTP